MEDLRIANSYLMLQLYLVVTWFLCLKDFALCFLLLFQLISFVSYKKL